MTARPRPRRKTGPALLFAAIVLTATGLLSASACLGAVDVSGSVQMPAWLTSVKERDDLAFPAHASLGTVLQTVGCNPSSGGLQWLKAAAHARNPGEIDQAAAGLRRAATCLGSPATLGQRLCPYVATGYANDRQRRAAEQAGLVCAIR